MEWAIVLVVVVSIALLVARDRSRRLAAEAEFRRREGALLALKIQRAVEKVESVKTTAARVNNCQKAIALMESAESNPECVRMIANYGEVLDRLRSIQKVLRAVDHVEKADRHQFKGNAAAEKSALLDALYEIRTKGVTNSDFDIAMVVPESTGEILRVESIVARLKELGWTEQP